MSTGVPATMASTPTKPNLFTSGWHEDKARAAQIRREPIGLSRERSHDDSEGRNSGLCDELLPEGIGRANGSPTSHELDLTPT